MTKQTEKPVVVRFAPSPTGYLHVGGARTALFNWLYARKTGGKFILRIEDTDTARNSPEATQAIFDGMNWLGMDWDEGPGKEAPGVKYFQTERLDIYNKYAAQLLESGNAYKCYRTREELADLRADAEARKERGSYRREWALEVPPAGEEARSFVVRFKAPLEGQIVIDDIVHGEVTFNVADNVEDFVLIKNDGIPTYNFAVVIDDATMGITHVIRGDDHLANTPKQICVYNALGFELPRFGHIPMILGPDKSKLSKRHGAVSVLQYDADGYLPEALMNYLVRLGWSSGDQEIFTKAEMIEAFNLEALNKTAAVFDAKKLDWLNAHYIKSAAAESLLNSIDNRVISIVGADAFCAAAADRKEWLLTVIDALKDRANNLNTLAHQVALYFDAPIELDPAAVAKFLTDEGTRHAAAALDLVCGWSEEAIHKALETYAEASGVKLGAVAQPLRVLLTGTTASPPINLVMSLMGKQLVEKRVYR